MGSTEPRPSMSMCGGRSARTRADGAKRHRSRGTVPSLADSLRTRVGEGTVTTTDLVEIGSAPAVTCRADASIAQAARTMAERNVGCVVVVDDDGCVAGIITDRDI